MADPLADFRALLTSHTQVVNSEREKIARRVGSIIAASGSKPLTGVDVTVAMARIDTFLDEIYGKGSDEFIDEEGSAYKMIIAESDRAAQLAKNQSNAIIEDELKDHPELIEMVRIQ